MEEMLLMSQRKLDQLQERLADLLREHRTNSVEMRHAVQSGGGTHDNASYEYLSRKQLLLQSQIGDLEQVLRRVRILQPPTDSSQVRAGCTIRLQNMDTGETEKMTIAGYEESDPERGFYSYLSPRAQVFLGRGVGQRVLFIPPDGKRRHFKILEIAITHPEKE